MKIISFGDVHEDTNNLIKIKSELENADLIVISGDLTNYHGKVEAKKVLESVKKYNKHLLAQYGNLDQPEVNEHLTGVTCMGMDMYLGMLAYSVVALRVRRPSIPPQKSANRI